MKRKKGYRRGYSVALLVGFEEDHAVLWQVFSNVAKLHQTVKLDGKRTDGKALYNFHESIVDALRPTLNEGARSVIATAPARTAYAADFLNHVQKHHSYLTQTKGMTKAAFAELSGSADQPHNVAELVKTKQFRLLIAETTSGDAEHTVDALEKYIYSSDDNNAALFSIKEIEDAVYTRGNSSDQHTKYLMLTDKYLAESTDKNRIHRLLQISKNRKVKTRIVNAETPAGKRISQFGGIILFTTPDKS